MRWDLRCARRWPWVVVPRSLRPRACLDDDPQKTRTPLTAVFWGPLMIAIVDYGVGNLRSVERALLHVGATPKLTADQDELQHADGMVLPGVAPFAPPLENLSHAGLRRSAADL